MSTNVDNRVVNMDYNGGKFDAGVTRSQKAFELFKTAIEGGGEAIKTAITSIDNKLSAKGIAIATVIYRMTDAAISGFKKLSDQFIKSPIHDGFSEYEKKMGALFNIFNAVKSKGSSFDDVQKSVKMLNEYSDKTIYNFGQMVQNFQRFTTQGRSLTQAGGIITGLSNLAASVGADNEALSRATYQMSQMNGVMNLMDYSSLANTNIASEKFRDTMIEVTKESGRMMQLYNGKEESNSAADYFEKATKNGMKFRDMISDKVFTEADFTETMRRFSIETNATQEDLDKLRTSFETVSKTEAISPDMLQKLKDVKADTGGFADEMVRV